MTYKPITDYIIIDAGDLLSLEQQVRGILHDNVQPLGGIAVRTASDGYPRYYQTLVKRGTKESKK